MDFGCFVTLDGIRGGREGLVHVSQLRPEGRVMHAGDVVTRGQQVKVKVLSVTSARVSLTMKEVDQKTGEDLLPRKRIDSSAAPSKHVTPDESRSNPIRPDVASSTLTASESVMKITDLIPELKGIDPGEGSLLSLSFSLFLSLFFLSPSSLSFFLPSHYPSSIFAL